MRYATETTAIDCPYCGERFDIVVDYSIPEQTYVEDCYVCCRPIHLSVHIDAQIDAQIDAGDAAEGWRDSVDGPHDDLWTGSSGVHVIARSENEC